MERGFGRQVGLGWLLFPDYEALRTTPRGGVRTALEYIIFVRDESKMAILQREPKHT